MTTKLPDNLNYSDIKPVGFPSHVRQEKFIPIAFQQQSSGVGPSDIIRYQISTNGFWDPYSAYIKIEIDVSSMDGIKDTSSTYNRSCGSLQIDNSASSIINQLIISKSGTEIERIEEYDNLAAILNDMNCSNDNRLTRNWEGMSSNCVPGGIQYNNSSSYNGSGNLLQFYNPFADQVNQTTSTGGFNGQQGFVQTNNGTNFSNGTTVLYGGLNRYETIQLSQETKSTVGTGKSACFGGSQTNTEYNLTQLFQGLPFLFNQSLSGFGNEALLSKNIKTLTTYKGQIGKFIFGDRQQFCIPIISGILGVLMPKESYKYIPMKPLQDLQLEFRLNPYGLFSSGYADGEHNVLNGYVVDMSVFNFVNRVWKLTKFEINVEMQYFESQVENIVLSQLNTEKGIVLHSQSWQLGPRYQFNGGQSPNGTYQINLGYESLKNILFFFQPDDYLTYPFCRKLFRLSANITSYYLKIGTEYYPPLPITGHGGNPTVYTSLNNDIDANNSEFLIQLYKTFGKFQDIQTNCIINNINFAVNQRGFDPTNKIKFDKSNYQNIDTALSLPLLHENRCVGRAIYAMNLETLNQDYSVISGLNTINNRPFELNLKADTTSGTQFTRPYQMIVMCNYDVLFQIKNSGVQVVGRG